VWRFRSPHHYCRAFVMRTSEPKATLELWSSWCPFDSEVRKNEYAA